VVKKRNLVGDDAYQKILNKILTFELLPGEVVSDFQLSQHLKMSRTPIREAMMRLMMEGLIEQGEKKMLVSCITPNDIKEICEVRDAIESKAISLIISKGGLAEEQLSHLYSLNEALERAVSQFDFVANFQNDDKLHSTLVTYSRNIRLGQYLNMMWIQFMRARWLTILKPRYHDTVLEHNEIIDAIAAKDRDRAVAAINAHLKNAAENFNTVLNDQNLMMLKKSIHLIHHKEEL
jgi:DNA-binding GntR family transcriptional regulator